MSERFSNKIDNFSLKENCRNARETRNKINIFISIFEQLFAHWLYKAKWNVYRTFMYTENRIHIRVEFRKSLGMNFVSPFQPEREFKVYKSCKCSQIICSTVHQYSMFPRLSISISKFLKLLNKLYKMN